MQKKLGSRGQALLVILLIVAVILTVALAVVSRSITDIKISEQSEESARAYSAAEAGIESALAGEADPSGSFDTGSFSTASVSYPESANSFAFPSGITNNEILTLWLSDYPNYTNSYTGSDITLYWGNKDTTQNPALEASFYYKEGSSYKVLKYALDPLSTRTPDNNFCNPPSCGSEVNSFSTSPTSAGGKTFQYNANVDLPSGVSLLFARLRVLYASQPEIVGASAGILSLPSQGKKIISTGTSGSSTRKVEVISLHPAPPEIFDFVLYSGTDLVKP